MPAIDIPLDFCGPTNVAQSPIFDGQTAMNCYCEKAEVPGAKSQIAMWHTPGKKAAFVLAGENSVPDTFTVNGRTFAAGANLWELFANGTAINRGNIGTPPFTPTQMVANQTQLVILNNGNLYVFTLATNVLTPVNMAQFNGPVAQIDFGDGYVVATIQNSHTFQQSNLSDATTWQGLNISTVSLFPDNIVSMKIDHRELWLFSAKKTAVYYNAGAGFPVFIPIQGAFLENGSGATFATTQLDNSLFWLDQDERGNMVARRANGYNGQRISTHAVELAWQQYAVTSDAVGYSYQEQGHTFWVLYFPTANATWVYDVASGYWHQRGFWNQATGTYKADRSMCHTFNFGQHLVGDPFSGTVYSMSSAFVTDNGSMIRGFRVSPVVSKNNEWIYFQSIEFDIEVGLAPAVPLLDGNGQPRPAQIMLDWLDDGGKTWSNVYYLSLGFTGQYKTRVKKRFLGRARKRVWRVTWTDPVPIRFIGAYCRGELEVAA